MVRCQRDFAIIKVVVKSIQFKIKLILITMAIIIMFPIGIVVQIILDLIVIISLVQLRIVLFLEMSIKFLKGLYLKLEL